MVASRLILLMTMPSLLTAMSMMAATCDAQETSTEAEAVFQSHVQPILQERCYSCHSHDAGVMEGGLALDWRSGWEVGGGRGPAILPGRPDDSLLIQAIRHTDQDLKMPEERLPDSEIEVLVQWVRAGAVDPRAVRPEQRAIDADWWSLRPLLAPAIPAVSETSVAAAGATDVVNPIDQFLNQKLQQAGLPLAQETDRRTLIRRLTVDLHGLLPDADVTDAFVADTDPRALENLIDQLLKSPRYGERWARHWMDTIHFADSHGFEHDVFRPHAWRFRDYLIRSFNEDTPWPQFIREQLAADVFSPDVPQRVAALGYLGAGTYDHSAAATAPENFENLDRDDMVTQTMSAFVSTTANCARCHDHKFDPITQADYYSLQAVFAGIGKGDIPYDDEAEVAASRRRWQQLKADLVSNEQAVLENAEYRQLALQRDQQLATTAMWSPLSLLSYVSIDGAALKLLEDGSMLSTGPLPE